MQPTTSGRIELTPTVESIVDSLSRKEVSSWEIVHILLQRHPEYGRATAREVSEGKGPPTGSSQPAEDWLQQVLELFEPRMVSRFHGRLFILGLCRLDAGLSDYLSKVGFLAALQDELREDFASLLRPEVAGPEAYRGAFLRWLHNRAKYDTQVGQPRQQGFLTIIEGGPGLEPIARLTQRQMYNQCFVARYTQPVGSTLSDTLVSFSNDLRALVADDTSTVGHLLPDPASEKRAWKQFVSTQLLDVLRNVEEKQRRLSSDALLERLLPTFEGDQVLRKGDRLVLLIELRGVSPSQTLGDVGLTPPTLEQMAALPERLAVVVSGLPSGLAAEIDGPYVLKLRMPLDPRLTRGQPLSNDVPVGPDRLNIATEIGSLAETIVLKDMNPPMVVGILGGWGSGKSFVLHLMEERLQEIRCERVPVTADGGAAADSDFPFVGHPYVIRFDAWTYAKSDLWASLMQTIFLELERQLTLEQVLQCKLRIDLRENTEIWRVLSRLNEEDRDRLTKTELGTRALQIAQQFDSGRITERILWDKLAGLKMEETARLRRAESELAAVQIDRDRTYRELEHKVDEQLAARAQLAAWRPVKQAIAKWVGGELEARLQAAEDVSLPTFDEVKASIAWYKRLLMGWGAAPLAFFVFAAVALIVGTVVFKQYKLPSALASAISTMIAGVAMAVKGYRWLEDRRRDYQNAFAKEVAIEAKSREALVKEALLVAGVEESPEKEAETETEHPVVRDPDVTATATALREQDAQLARKQAEVMALRQKVGITARHDSLLDFVKQRLEGKYYEDKLGLLQQVQADLAELSTALLPSRATQEVADGAYAETLDQLFPRGQPRIILIVDDLDRCPPDKVVDVLEAAQLLVKTPLFVVVIAMDVRYVTRALEKAYVDVLVRGGEPSGLDYIEKIVQIPYRVRPASPASIGGFLRSQMRLAKLKEEEAEASSTGQPEEEEVEDEVPTSTSSTELEGELGRVALVQPTRTELRPLPTEILEFKREEHQIINVCCSAVEVSPRAMKRLVNVFKLMKIIWYRQGLEDGPDDAVKQTMLALLALAARFPDVTRELLRHMEGVFRQRGDFWEEPLTASLAARCEQAARTAIYPPDWHSVQTALLDSRLFTQNLTYRDLQESNFNLISSFSFVGETDPEREAALQKRIPLFEKWPSDPALPLTKPPTPRRSKGVT